jgi:hypothetical protein
MPCSVTIEKNKQTDETILWSELDGHGVNVTSYSVGTIQFIRLIIDDGDHVYLARNRVDTHIVDSIGNFCHKISRIEFWASESQTECINVLSTKRVLCKENLNFTSNSTLLDKKLLQQSNTTDDFFSMSVIEKQRNKIANFFENSLIYGFVDMELDTKIGTGYQISVITIILNSYSAFLKIYPTSQTDDWDIRVTNDHHIHQKLSTKNIRATNDEILKYCSGPITHISI